MKEPKHFIQTCVFAEHRKIGDIDVFPMKSGRTVVVKLKAIDSSNYQWTADDTGQRDLMWEEIDEVVEIKDYLPKAEILVLMKSGKEIAITLGDRMKMIGPFGRRTRNLSEILLDKLTYGETE